MTVFALISLISCLIALFLGNYIYSLDRKNRLNRIYYCFSISISYWAFTEFMWRQASDYNIAHLWLEVGGLWPFAIALYMHFILIFSEKTRQLQNVWTYVLIYVPALIFAVFELTTDLITSNPIREYWGYTYSISEYSLISGMSTIWAVCLSGLALLLCIRLFFRTSVRKKKQQAKYVIIGLGISMILGAVTEGIFPVMNIKFPGLTVTSFIVECILIGFAIWKYRLFSVNPETAAKNILSTMPNILILLDPERRIKTVNKLLLDISGYEESELIGEHGSFLLALEEKPREPKFTEVLFKEGKFENFETILQAKDGEKIPIVLSASLLKDDNGEISGIVGVARDVRENLKMQTLLNQEKERLRVTLESIGDGVIAIDTKGKIQFMNRTAEELTGWSEHDVQSKDFRKIFKLANKETGRYCKISLDKIKDSGNPHGLDKDTVLVSRLGEERYLSNSTAPIKTQDGTIIGYVLAFRDITQRKHMEEEVLKGQKLEAIALLAGGIAHDFNNLLTGILGNLTLAKMKLPDDGSELAQIITDADHAAIQTKKLTKQLLTFSKGGAPIIKSTDIVELVKESITFILRGSDVKCTFDIPDGIWPVDVDKGQINQVINNLVINAKQAMPEKGEIYTYLENVSQSLKRDGVPLPTGNYVKMSIQDNGIGIPRKYLTKIFDPYFTTKQDGNGLGLATTFSIIRKHNGHITLESEPGKGTVFHIYLPASDKKVENTKEFLKKNIKGHGRILLMDDDDIVRTVTGKMLMECGYKVVNAKDGEEALRMYRESMNSEDNIDVVIMDLTIPGGMGGQEAVKKLLKIDSNAKTIVGSGYSNDRAMAEYAEFGFKACVPKPYALDELVFTIQNVMNKKAGLGAI